MIKETGVIKETGAIAYQFLHKEYFAAHSMTVESFWSERLKKHVFKGVPLGFPTIKRDEPFTVKITFEEVETTQNVF